jgi:hypothetical protein
MQRRTDCRRSPRLCSGAKAADCRVATGVHARTARICTHQTTREGTASFIMSKQRAPMCATTPSLRGCEGFCSTGSMNCRMIRSAGCKNTGNETNASRYMAAEHLDEGQSVVDSRLIVPRERK